MTGFPNRIRELREERGWSQAELAKTLKTSQPQIDRLEKGARKLTQDYITKFARALGVEAVDILSAQPKREQAATPHVPLMRGGAIKQNLEFRPGAQSPSFTGPRDLPILGHGKAGVEGFFVDNGDVQGYAMRPDILAGVKNAYAIYVQDASMSPAFEPGFLVWVDPNRPPQPGNDVVIQLNDGQALIKRLKRRTARAWVFEQFNPRQDLEWAPAKIAKVHLIVGGLRVRT